MQELKLTDFPIIAFDKLRYSDTDRQGHVNNTVFSTFLETGRVEFLFNADPPILKKDCSFVLASIDLNLVGEIFWPGTVDIGTGIIHIGKSSVKLYQHIYQNEHLVATALTVIVQVNSFTKSEPLSEDSKIALHKFKLSEE